MATAANNQLSRVGIETLLGFCTSFPPEVGGAILRDHYPKIRSELIANQWLEPSGNLGFVQRWDEYDTEEHELDVEWIPELEGFGYFCRYSGWVKVDSEELKLYRVKTDKLLTSLQRSLGIPERFRLTSLVDDRLWDLGTARFGKLKVQCYFVCDLGRSSSRKAFLQAMRRESAKAPAIILYPEFYYEDEIEMPLDMRLVPLQRVLSREQDQLALDENLILSQIKSAPRQDDAEGGIGPRFSTDYRLVHWNGEQYRLTKKQAAVFEALDREGGRAHKDLLQAEAGTNEALHRILRNKIDGKWQQHPLWGTLIKSLGEGYYCIDHTASIVERV